MCIRDRRRPAFTRRSFSSAAFSSTPALCMATGRTMTWMGAILGGRTRPLLSPWAMMTCLLYTSGVDVLTKEQFRELADQRMNPADIAKTAG